MASYLVSGNGTINLYAGKQFAIPTTHPNYNRIKEGLGVLSDGALRKLADIPLAVNKFLGGKAEVKFGTVYFNGEPVHGSMANRILEQMNQGFPVGPMLKFLENLMLNPSSTSVEELYDFLDHKGLPITEDGCFLAYKGVRSDFMDAYSRTISNKPGEKPEMPRNKVDDNRSRTCSKGLHVGVLEYARNYCNENIVLVKVNPKDVVSVPLDHDAMKCRVERYEVLEVYESHEPIQGAVWGVDPTDDNWMDDEDDYNNEFYDDEDDFEDEYDEIDEDDDEDICGCGDPYCTY